MYHSITFGTDLTTKNDGLRNTWDDWHLIPASRPSLAMPQPELRLVQIPGKNGSLDVTGMNGNLTYGDRTGTFDFYVENDYWKSWSEAYSEIARYLHGKKLRCMLEDDDKYFYEGRFVLNQWKSNKTHSTISIGYQVGPYKRNRYPIGYDWLWDEMSFQPYAYRIWNYQNLIIDYHGITVPIEGYGYRTIPTIVTSDTGVMLSFDNQAEISLAKGTNTPPSVVVTEGKHTISLRVFENTTKKVTVSIIYYGGSI